MTVPKDPLLVLRAQSNPTAPPVILDTVMRVSTRSAQLWEERLRLIINDRPRWMPGFVWKWVVRLVLRQEKEMRWGA